MKKLRILIPIFMISFLILFNCCTGKKGQEGRSQEDKTGNFHIGWSSANITPDRPVLLAGQRHARISEGVMDSVTATVLAIESGTGSSSGKVLMISCELVGISDGLLDNVRNLIKDSLPEISPEQVILNATHTHTAPYCSSDTVSKSIYGIELDAMAPSACQKFISERIAKAAISAWKSRKPGGISFGLGQAVVGHNRLQVDYSGKSRKYGNTNRPEFSHIEGFEDHSVNLLYTWDKESKLTGIIINVACPSQVSENEFLISADYWHDTRLEVRQRLGKDVYILPQCSAAGDLSPHIMVGAKAEERMQRIMGTDSIKTGRGSLGRRKQIAMRIADAVTSVFPYMKDSIDWNPVFDHRMEQVELSRRLIGIEDVNNALKEAGEFKKQYDQLLRELKENPGIKEKARWYTTITRTYTQTNRGNSVKERYELEKRQHKMSVDIHVVRIGDVVFASNPFELYLDFGIQIKARSSAIQTFLVQLAGKGTYLPPFRSVAGGSYGAEPASTLIGPEGGEELVDKTLELINEVMVKKMEKN